MHRVMRALAHLYLCGFVILLVGCGPEPGRDSPAVDMAFKKGFRSPIVDRQGKTIGSAVGTPDKEGLVVRFQISGLTAGDHGIHLHSSGRCDPPSFASAGPHWDVDGRQHGHDNPKGPHDGDWGNLTVFPSGQGNTDRLIPRWHNRIPQTGLALVIHAGKDDELTDPSGNSGERIACAVVIPSG